MPNPPSEIRNLPAGRQVQNPKPLRPVIGLLGGIGSGKSLVAAQFRQFGCAVVDADAVGHVLLAEPAIRDGLRQRFGDGILDASGGIDRRALGRRAFADDESRLALESIVHPELWRRVRLAVDEARRTDVPAVVLDAALILEKGLDTLCRVLVYIEVPKTLRRARVLQTRGWDPEEADRREASQVSLKTKQQRADFHIDNGSSPEHTLDQVRTILSRVTTL